MNKSFIVINIFYLSLALAGEISVSISEGLVNEYLQLIGDHEIPKGKKGDQALWAIKNPYVIFEHGSAEFHSTITFKKGKTNLRAATFGAFSFRP